MTVTVIGPAGAAPVEEAPVPDAAAPPVVPDGDTVDDALAADPDEAPEALLPVPPVELGAPPVDEAPDAPLVADPPVPVEMPPAPAVTPLDEFVALEGEEAARTTKVVPAGVAPDEVGPVADTASVVGPVVLTAAEPLTELAPGVGTMATVIPVIEVAPVALAARVGPTRTVVPFEPVKVVKGARVTKVDPLVGSTARVVRLTMGAVAVFVALVAPDGATISVVPEAELEALVAFAPEEAGATTIKVVPAGAAPDDVGPVAETASVVGPVLFAAPVAAEPAPAVGTTATVTPVTEVVAVALAA